MELIPILATIILVATISTFILAIGAYILYKVRERRSIQVEAVHPATVQAELVTPELIHESEQIHVKSPSRQGFDPRRVPTARPSAEPIFVQQGPSGVQPAYAQQKENDAQRQQSGPQKLMKVTSEGYVPAKEEQKPGAVKWR
ncbi:MAG: hypothetical protein C0425_04670 [Chlorobiaceae bacterium]|nr:hypothetical protein [Chlorobiaceae bacterium]MBA4309610.1 hypothetical protein [Chlorobiaceae bacterium]